MPDFTKRKDQVIDEGIGSIPSKSYFPSRVVLHSHQAEKSGPHYDLRLDINNKAVSFATRKGLPKEPGQPVLMIRQPDHQVSYMDWEGDIAKGEYGAGNVKKALDKPVVAKADPDKIQFTISDKGESSTYVLFKKEDNNWLAVKKSPMKSHWSERPKYKEMDSPIWDSTEHIYAEKLDGAHFIATINPNGISFTSQRKSKSGDLIRREDQVPHLRDLKLPAKYHGLVIRGELWHDKGFNTLSGLLNSKPEKAVADQQTKGMIRFAPFAIESAPKEVADLPYDKQVKYLKELCDVLPSYIDIPRISEKDHKNFYESIARTGGEGVVITKKDKSERLKVKSRLDYDLEISGFTPGEGKYSGKGIGAIVLKDKTGRTVGKVGTGLTDSMRQDMFKNPDKYLGSLIKVTSRKPLKGNLREPSFLGLTLDKDEPDEVK